MSWKRRLESSWGRLGMKSKTVVLSEVCDLVPGFAFKSKDFGDYSTKVIKIADIAPPDVNMNNLIGVDISKYNALKLEKFLAFQGDYILAMTGATIGKIGRIENGTAYINQRVLLFRPKSNIDKDFLYYVIRQPSFYQFVISFVDSDTAQPNISAGTIGKYSFLLPPMMMQRRIAKILKSIDDKIFVNKQINDNLQQQAFSLFAHLFFNNQNGYYSVSNIALLNPKRFLAKNQTAKCIDMSQLSTTGAFPAGWEEKPFNGGIRFTNGDTLLARITPCLENGKTAFIDFLDEGEVAFGSTEYIVLAPKEGIPPEFLYCLARYPLFVEYAVKNMNGSSGRQRISADTIGQFQLPRLSDDDYVHFGEIVSPLFLKMRNNSLENMRLSALRDTLLPKLISVELSVANI